MTSALLGRFELSRSPGTPPCHTRAARQDSTTPLRWSRAGSTLIAQDATYCSSDETSCLVVIGGAPLPAAVRTSLERCRTAGRLDNACLSSVHGPFAIVLVDLASRTVSVAVDRFGQKSLYYRLAGTTLSVSERLADLMALEPAAMDLSNQAIVDYLYFHCIPSPRSILVGVSKVERAQCVEVCAEGPVARRYWIPSFAAQDASPSAGEACAQLHAILHESVAASSAGNSVGTFLSGGLDSSTVTGLLARARPGASVPAVSMGFDASGYDEIEYARIAARRFGVQHVIHYVTPDEIAANVEKVAAGFDEPFGNSSALPTFVCASVARQAGIQLLLAGDGGDELFGGNERYGHQLIFERYNASPPALKALLRGVLAASPPGWRRGVVAKAISFQQQADTPLPARLQHYNFLNQIAATEVFEDGCLMRASIDRPLQDLQRVYSEPVSAGPVDRMLHLDWKYTLQDNDLVKVSTACRLAGIAVRFPLLSDALLEFSCRLPERWKVRRQRLRVFYREAMRDFLPDEILSKPKHGFGLPFGVWLRKHPSLSAIAYDSVSALRARPWFQSRFLTRVIDMHRSGHAAYYGELIWILMTLELWLQSNWDRRGSRRNGTLALEEFA